MERIMSYQKTDWLDRIAEDKNRFAVSGAVTGDVWLVPKPGNIIQAGTPFNVNDMNKIEQGIYDAHEELRALREAEAFGYYREFAFEPSPAQLIAWRILPAQGQMVLFADYQRLCEKMWVGSAANATADWWYRTSDEAGTQRDPSGAYIRVLDIKGLFLRAAGANSKYRMASDAPYDGLSIGAFGQDRIQRILGAFYIRSYALTHHTIADPQGAFAFNTINDEYYSINLGELSNQATNVTFDSARTVHSGLETAPAWVAAYYCLAY
jgi:hypothetical protein